MKDRGRTGIKERLLALVERAPSEIASFVALSLSSAANQLVRFFTGVINARLLTPALYATNSIAMLVVRYSSYAHLGIQNGMNRQLPIEYGRGDDAEADRYLYSAFWFVGGASLVLAMAAAVAYFGRVFGTGLIERAYYPEILLLAVATLFYQYFISFLVATHQFRLLSALRAKYDLPAVIVTTIAVVFFRLHGLLLVQSLSMFLQIAVIVRHTGFRPRAIFSTKHAMALLRAGSPILTSSLLIYAFMTVDLMFVSGHFDRVSIGIYGFANNAAFFYRTYAVSMSDVLQPKIGNEYGAGQERPECLRRFALDYTYALAPALGMIAAVFYFLLPVVVMALLPSYARGIRPLQLLLLAEYTLSLYYPAGHILTLMRKQVHVILVIGSGIALASGLFLLFIRSTSPLENVSLIWLFVSVVVSFTMIIMGTWLTTRDTGLPWLTLGRNLLTGTAVVGVFIGLAAVPAPGPGLAWVIVAAGVRLVVCEAIMLVMLLTIDPSNPIVVKVRDMVLPKESAAA
jgi:O-antigen/teichoic acid export membrane protein